MSTMVWQRIFNHFAKSTRPVRRKEQKRRLRLERLDARALMAADIGIIEGIAFTDNSGDGLTSDDVRLGGVTVSLYRDTNNNGTLETTGVGADTLLGTTTTDSLASATPGRYRFGTGALNLGPGQYLVEQTASGTLTAPAVQLVTLATGSVQAQAIDTFDQTAVPLTSATLVSTPINQSFTATEALGGERDVVITVATDNGNIGVQVTPANQRLTIGSSDTAGTVLVQYDGTDGSTTLSPTGLGGISLNGGETKSGMNISVSTDQVANGSFQLRVYTDATNFSTVTLNYPAGSDVAPVELFVPFSSFTQGVGAAGPANFNNVGAIEQFVDVEADQDVRVSLLESIRPEVATANLANVQFVSLGGQVFLDNASGTNNQNNGIRDASEPGRDAVTVELYQVTDPSGTVDVSATAAFRTTTTGANGAYNFDNLLPGNYIVAIPSSQFASGQRLFGFGTSTGNDPAPDPDTNIVGDDNGTVDVNGNVVTLPITIAAGGEPDTGVDGNDTNMNNTVGFGFVPLINLVITKTLNATASTVSPGGTAVFDILVENQGPLDATGVRVSDALPDGLTFQQITNATGTFTTNGTGTTANPLIVTLGSLPSGTSQAFRIVSAIGATQTTDLTNVATVTGNEVETDITDNTDDALLDLPSSDLRISKTDTPDPVSAGGTLTYTITVTNDGPDAAAGVQVTDPLPAGVTFVRGFIGTDPGAANPDNRVAFNATTRIVTANIGALANAAASTITVIVTVGPSTVGPLSNVATVTATPNTDPDPDNNDSTAPTDINRVVDVAVTKTASTNPIAGGQVTYTIVVTNNNPSAPGDARGVVVTDTLNSQLTFDSFNAQTSGVTQTTGATAQDLVFTVGDLAFGQSKTFSFVADIASSATGTIPNTAVVTTTDNDILASNNTEQEPITVGRTFDLLINKTVDRTSATPGQDQLVYTITVSHDTDSVSDAPAFFVEDILPAGLSNQVIAATTASSTPTFNSATRTARVDFDGLALGQTRTFTITVNVDSNAVGNTSGAIVNPATVNAGATEADTTNNSASATTTLTPNFDVTVNKSTTSTNVGPGDTITYTIGVTKSGPSQARNVTLTDAIPTGLTFVSGTLNGATATSTGGTISFPAFNLDNNTPLTGTLVFTVGASATAGTITNTAVVAAAGESNTNNNTASADVTVVPRADVRVSKSVSAASANTGATLTYTITVTNDGPSTAASVQAIDTLPAGVTFVSGTGPGGTALSAPNAQRQITVAGGDLASAGSFTFTINATIDANATGTLQNSVAVTTLTSEGNNTANNSATATTTVNPRTSSLSGVVFVDNNRDGIFNTGDTVQSGVTVQLTGTESSGTPVTASQVTGANGTYNFQNLAAGTYRVQRTDKPANLLSGAEQVGSNATANVDAVDNAFTQLGLGENIQATNFNFGLLNEPVSKRRFLASTVQ